MGQKARETATTGGRGANGVADWSSRSGDARAWIRRSREVVLFAGVTGLLTGLVVALFERIVVEELLARVLEAPLWVAALAPAVGLVGAAVLLRFLGRGTSPGTADEYLHAFHDPQHTLGGRALVVRMVAAVSTLGAGGAMGLEGPSMFAGASIGSLLQRRLPRVFGDADRRALLVAGAAAGVAAIFKAPATGAVFALEVPYRGDLARHTLLPALVAAASGYLVFVSINGTTPLFSVFGNPAFSVRDLGGAVVLGVGAGLGARAFASLLLHAKRLAASTSAWLRVPVAGAVLAVLFVVCRALTGESLTLGSGYQAMSWATDPEHSVWIILAVLVLRCAATAAVLGGGGVGGLFVPLVVGGALVGRAVGGAFEALDTSLFSVLGIAAFLGAGYRVPLAAVTFIAETTGKPGFVVPGLFAAVAAELMMGRSSVTAYQRDSGPEPGGRSARPSGERRPTFSRLATRSAHLRTVVSRRSRGRG
jgi:chloride channel protein, CIC family